MVIGRNFQIFMGQYSSEKRNTYKENEPIEGNCCVLPHHTMISTEDTIDLVSQIGSYRISIHNISHKYSVFYRVRWEHLSRIEKYKMNEIHSPPVACFLCSFPVTFNYIIPTLTMQSVPQSLFHSQSLNTGSFITRFSFTFYLIRNLLLLISKCMSIIPYSFHRH